MRSKIIEFEEIEETLECHKKRKEKIVQCHGVFDLLHPGHIRHFKEAKEQGDKLIVSITPDKYVNKGPNRPAFNEKLRLESIASLAFVDYVVLNKDPDAINIIKKIKPNVYVKGKEYKDLNADITKKIKKEIDEVTKGGGKVFFSEDIVFSSSSLINKYIDPLASNVESFVSKIKQKYSIEDLLEKIHDLSKLKVLIIGDAIIDEYQYVDPLGQSGKGQHLVASLKKKEIFLGGSLMIANHVSEFSNNVTLLTAVGAKCKFLKDITKLLDKKVDFDPLYIENKSTLVKKRYVLKDGSNLTKFFETYSHNESLLQEDQTQKIIDFIDSKSKDFDLILVSDFGNGFINEKIIRKLSSCSTYLALNTQTNSGNRGYNVVTHYDKADYISLNEPEIRLAAHDQRTPLEQVIEKISNKMKCDDISVTQGSKGVLCFSKHNIEHIPAFVTNTVDRVGAGDSFFAISSLCRANNYSLNIAGFLGSIASALDVQIVGNRFSIKKEALCKFMVRLLK